MEYCDLKNVVPTVDNFMWAWAWNSEEDIFIQPDGWGLSQYRDNEPEEWQQFIQNSVRCCSTSNSWKHPKKTC